MLQKLIDFIWLACSFDLHNGSLCTKNHYVDFTNMLQKPLDFIWNLDGSFDDIWVWHKSNTMVLDLYQTQMLIKWTI